MTEQYPSIIEFEHIREILKHADMLLSVGELRMVYKLPRDMVYKSLQDCDLHLIKAKDKLNKMMGVLRSSDNNCEGRKEAFLYQ